MGFLICSMASISTFHPEQNPALAGEGVYNNVKTRNKNIHRVLGNITTLSANAYRHRIGREFNKPNDKMDYAENFLFMLDRLN